MITERVYRGTVTAVEKGHYDFPKGETYWTLRFKTGAISVKVRGQKFSTIKAGDKVYFTGDLVDTRFDRKQFRLKKIYRKENDNLLEYQNYWTTQA